MDPYLTALLLGGVGLAAMAIGGGARHGGRAHGSAHGGHAGHAPAPGPGHGAAHGSSPGHQVAHGHHASHGSARAAASRSFLALVSPRILFSLCLGAGAAGLVARPLLGGGIILFAVALGGGVLFERLIVTPLWNFGFRFESKPALTLESAVQSEATVVSSFDANGQGLIAVELDGQLVQVLGTLRAADRALGARVPSGSKVRIEEVDAERNRCTVSLL